MCTLGIAEFVNILGIYVYFVRQKYPKIAKNPRFGHYRNGEK